MRHYLKWLCLLSVITACKQEEKKVTLQIKFLSYSKAHLIQKADYVLLMNKSITSSFLWGLKTQQFQNIKFQRPGLLVLKDVPQSMQHVSVNLTLAGKSYFGYADRLTLANSVNTVEIHIQPSMIRADVESVH